MKPPFLRTEFNYDIMQASNNTGIDCSTAGPSMAQQHFRDECDINTLVERFKLTGEVPVIAQLPSHGDFTGIFDYQSAMNAIVAARETFQTLPAKIRSRFDNDPHKFVEFCDDPDNLHEAVKMGIALPPRSTVETPAEPPKLPEGAKVAPKTPPAKPTPPSKEE